MSSYGSVGNIVSRGGELKEEVEIVKTNFPTRPTQLAIVLHRARKDSEQYSEFSPRIKCLNS